MGNRLVEWIQMYISPPRKLKGQECYCTGCGFIFTGETSFSKHRKSLKCLPVIEFKRIGLVWKEAKGRWGLPVCKNSDDFWKKVSKPHKTGKRLK